MRWVGGTFGALALLFLPGLGLADIGALTGWRLALTCALFVIGFGTAIASAIAVINFAQLGNVTLDQLVDDDHRRRRSQLVAYVDDNPSLFQGEATTVAELHRAYWDALTRLYREHQEQPPDETRLEIASARAGFLAQVVRSIEMSVSLHELRLGFAARRRQLAGAAAVVAFAMLGFAWVAHPPDPSVGDLSGARLIGLDLSGVNLHDADLSDVHFERVNLRDANLDGADLDGTTWEATTCPDGAVANDPSASADDPAADGGGATSCVLHLLRPLPPTTARAPGTGDGHG